MEKAERRRLERLKRQDRRAAERYEKAKPPAFASVQQKIPDGLREKLETAFCKGFRLVFEKGEGVIGRTYDADQLRAEYERCSAAVDAKATGASLRRLRRGARSAVRGGTGIALAEGAALGAFGVGLPDIPLFLGGLLRGLYRIALSYGFDCSSDRERCYLLLLIAVSLSKGEARERFAAAADAAACGAAGLSLDECMDAAAGCLAEQLLTAKFIQGLPIVGVAGGLQNVPVYRRITACAARAYERRWLLDRDKKM
ncbi:MAG: EcsC family protein [Agathobaculum sp.]|jgi:hypothetical protein|uniref:EcsC family protein n=1 Tax=Agathobaculum sp. TaxID=2048138 RepID=UPI003D8C0139